MRVSVERTETDYIDWLAGNLTGVIATEAGNLELAVPNAPTFTRNSIAFDADGVEVASGVPRFWPGPWPGRKALMIEAGTTNLFPADRSLSFDSAWTSGTLNGTYTVSIRAGTGKLVLSGGATGEVAVGGYLVFDVSSAAVTFTPTDGTPMRSQLEARAFPTLWHLGEATRAVESLTLPSGLIALGQPWTVEWVSNVTQTMYDRTDMDWPCLWSTLRSIGGEGLTLVYRPHGWTWGLRLRNNAGVYTSSDFTRAAIPVGHHRFRLVSDATHLRLYVDGGTTPLATLSWTAGPSGFGPSFLGSMTAITYPANTTHCDLRISRIARPDGGDWANPLPVDEHTVYYLPLNESLVRGCGGHRQSPDLSLDAVGIAASSVVSWNASTPSGALVTVEARLDGEEWRECVNDQPLPCITSKQNVSGRDLEIRQKLISTDVMETPTLQLHDLMVGVYPLHQASLYDTLTFDDNPPRYGTRYYGGGVYGAPAFWAWTSRLLFLYLQDALTFAENFGRTLIYRLSLPETLAFAENFGRSLFFRLHLNDALSFVESLVHRILWPQRFKATIIVQRKHSHRIEVDKS